MRNISGILSSTGLVSIINYETSTSPIGMLPDIVLNIISDKKRYVVAVALKSRGEPSYIREAALRVNGFIESGLADYGIIAAPYIAHRGFDICRELSVGCVDASGNILFNFAGVYIEKSGYPNINIRTRLSADMFKPKSSRVLRALLNNPSGFWSGLEMSAETGISVGQVSNVRRTLRENEYIIEDKRRFKVNRPEALLKEWADNYNPIGNQLYYYHSLDRLGVLEGRVAELFENNNISYAFTLFSAADKIAPYADYFQVHIYVNEIPENILKTSDIKSIPKEANLVLMIPYDEGVFYQSRTVSEYSIVCNIQLYLDLYMRGGRAKDAAKYLYENVIRNDWSI